MVEISPGHGRFSKASGPVSFLCLLRASLFGRSGIILYLCFNSAYAMHMACALDVLLITKTTLLLDSTRPLGETINTDFGCPENASVGVLSSCCGFRHTGISGKN